jgi:putative membrane protein
MKELLSKNLSLLFTLFLVAGTLSFLINAIWGLWQSYPLLYLLPSGLLALVLIGHALLHLGGFRTVIFFLISGTTAWVAEHLAITYQPFGAYEFHLKSGWSIGYLPVSVLLGWCFFIYIGYSVSNAGWRLWASEKPGRNTHAFGALLLLVLCDAWLITSVDLMIDPVQQFEKNWTWVEGGAFFGVPPGNFLGWLAVVGVASFCFRTWEYFFPSKHTACESNWWIPVAVYVLIAAFYLYAAHKYFGWVLAGIGIVTMLPIPVFIFISHLKSKGFLTKSKIL